MDTLHIILLILSVLVAFFAFFRIGQATEAHRISKKIRIVSDVYEQKDKNRTKAQILHDKHMQLINELCKLNALQEQDLGNGKILLRLDIYKV